MRVYAPQPSFARWLRAQHRRHSMVGDLARDVIEDVRVCCLRQITTPAALLDHLTTEHYPDPGALGAIEAAVAEWQEVAR